MTVMGTCLCGECGNPAGDCAWPEGYQDQFYFGVFDRNVTEDEGFNVNVVRLPEDGTNATENARYNKTGECVVEVASCRNYKLVFGLLGSNDTSLTNGVRPFTVEGVSYLVDAAGGEIFENLPLATHKWQKLGSIGSVTNAVDGDYLYFAWASDALGSGFTTTYNAALGYVAVLRSPTALPAPPEEEDFADLWQPWSVPGGPEVLTAPVSPATSHTFAARTTHILLRGVPEAPDAPGGVPPSPCTLVVTYDYFGDGAAVLNFTLTRQPDCGCPHIIGETADCDPDGVLSFSAGEFIKPIDVPVIEHDGPQYWGCEADIAQAINVGYELAALAVTSITGGAEINTGVLDSETLFVTCTHDEEAEAAYNIATHGIYGVFLGPGTFPAYTGDDGRRWMKEARTGNIDLGAGLEAVSWSLEYHWKSFPRVKELLYDEGGNNLPSYTPGGTMDEDSFDQTYGSEDVQGTLTGLKTQADNEAEAARLLALGDLANPAHNNRVFCIQPADGSGAVETGNESTGPYTYNDDDPDADTDVASLALPPQYNCELLTVPGSGGQLLSAIPAFRLAFDVDDGRRLYVLKKYRVAPDFTLLQPGRAHVLTRVYVAWTEYDENGDEVTSGETDLEDGVPLDIDAPASLGHFKTISVETETEFRCHPGEVA